MPSIAQVPIPPISKPKRKREDTSFLEDITTKSLMQPEVAHVSKSLYLTQPTALYFTPQSQLHAGGYSAHGSVLRAKEMEYHGRSILHPIARRSHESSKRQRISVDSQEGDIHTTFYSPAHNTFSSDNTKPVAAGTEADRENKPKIDLNPCHICHRKPTIKSELDQYANCEGCTKRTCYICIRECSGSSTKTPLPENSCYETEDDHDMMLSFHSEDTWFDGNARNRRERVDSGYEGGDEGADPEEAWGKVGTTDHKRKVCSRCCIERGTEGEVLCFGCLRVETGG